MNPVSPPPTGGERLTDLYETLRLSIDEGSDVPLYAQLREQLRTRILASEWDAAQALPPEETLAKGLGVSRSTVRQALDDLRREGLIVRRAGRGTFVRQARLVLRMEQFLSFRDEMRERGLEPSARLVSIQEIGRGRRVYDLDFDHPREKVIWVRTLRLANSRPAILFDHYFPAGRCGFLLSERLDVPDLSLHELLESHGLAASGSSGEVRAAKIDPVEAELLELLPGEAVIEVATRTADRVGRTFEYARSLVRTDRYALLLQSDWSPS